MLVNVSRSKQGESLLDDEVVLVAQGLLVAQLVETLALAYDGHAFQPEVLVLEFGERVEQHEAVAAVGCPALVSGQFLQEQLHVG